MNIVHLVVVETLSTLWNLEEPFTKFSSFQSYFGDQKNLVKLGLNRVGGWMEIAILMKTQSSNLDLDFDLGFVKMKVIKHRKSVKMTSK